MTPQRAVIMSANGRVSRDQRRSTHRRLRHDDAVEGIPRPRLAQRGGHHAGEREIAEPDSEIAAERLEQTARWRAHTTSLEQICELEGDDRRQQRRLILDEGAYTRGDQLDAALVEP